jgi:hypothetical protein
MGIRRLQAIRDLGAAHAVFAIRLAACSLPREKKPKALTCVAAGTSDRQERQRYADCRFRRLCAASYAFDNWAENEVTATMSSICFATRDRCWLTMPEQSCMSIDRHLERRR